MAKQRVALGAFKQVALSNPNYKSLYISALSEANQMEYSDLRPYFDRFVTGDTSKLSDVEVAPVAKICFLEAHGAQLSDQSLKFRAARLKQLLNKIKFDVVKVVATKRKSVADFIADKTRELLLEVDDCIDRRDFTKTFTQLIEQLELKAIDAKLFEDRLQRLVAEFTEVVRKTDPELVESYSGFPAKEAAVFLVHLIQGARDFTSEKITLRKPRAKKKITPEKMVSKLKYLKTFPELKLESVDPKKVVGATQIWVYNVKTRKLGVYNAEANQALMVKGSTILYYDQESSICKKVRKPDVQVPPVVKAGKVELRNTMQKIRAVASKLNGRMNNDTLILKVV